MHRVKKIAFIKLHDIWFDTEEFKKSKYKIVCLHTNKVLSKSQYDFVLVAKTFLLQIDKSEEQLLQGMESKSCRYPIRKSIKDGISIKRATNEEELKRYIAFQNAFCIEKGIPTVSENELDSLQVYYAMSPNGEYLGGCSFIVSSEDSTARYKYGATLHKLNANEAILWKAICDFREQEIRYFDFGGCIPTEDKDSYYSRHYHFKKKFGGELIDSYCYFRFVGPVRLLYGCASIIVNLFFNGDVNGAIVWLNKFGLIGDY